MRKKWGMILGLTGMMLLGAQSIYAAEAADGTAETTDAANEKETAGADDIESKIKKGGFTAGASVHDPSVIKDNDTYYIFGSHMESAKSTDLRNWTGFSSGVNAENKLFDNLFDGEEDGDPAAFTYVGKNEEGGYSVWAPDVIYNKKMGKYVMYFCTTSSYVKSNICFATADDIEGPYHYEDTFLYSGYSYHDVKESNIEELMGTDPRPYTAASYDNNNWPNCIDPDVFYDKDGRMWMVYGSWSGGIFLIEIDEETGYPIYPEADEETMYRCALHAQADSFIQQLDDGYETIVGERGLGISGGQKQRVSIARALLKNSPVLILDDSTSALDMDTEKKLLASIKEHYNDKTLIISAHRMTSVMDCDEIIYLSEGKIVERGTFDELMKLDGHFAKVYHTQEAQKASVVDFDHIEGGETLG